MMFVAVLMLALSLAFFLVRNRYDRDHKNYDICDAGAQAFAIMAIVVAVATVWNWIHP